MLLTNSSFANTANIKSTGSVWVIPTSNINATGFITGSGEVDPVNASIGRRVKPFDVSIAGRHRSGSDSVLWNDKFNHTIFNTYKYQGTTSTMTITLNNGVMRFNSGNSVASGAVARVQTYRTFPMIANFGLNVEFWAGVTQVPLTQNVIEFGLGFAATTAAPTDGVYFRLAGSLFQGVMNQNGQETYVNLRGYAPISQEMDHYMISIQMEQIKFFKNDIAIGTLFVPIAAGAPSYSQALPLLMREYNKAALLSATPQQFVVGSVSVIRGGMDASRQWPTVMCGMGQSSIVTPDGMTPNSTSNFANSAAPTSVTLSQTSGGYNTLGGQWQYAAVASTENDYSLFAYQVPTANSAAPGKNLVIRGVRIDTVNTGAANDAATPTSIQWALGVGSTAISPATVDDATAGTRSERTMPLGIQTISVSSPIGRKTNEIDINFDTPIVCEPGTYVQVYNRPFLGVATGSQVIRGIVMFNGYWE